MLRKTSGKGDSRNKEPWWWNEGVQRGIKEKEAKKRWERSSLQGDKEEWKRANKKAKKEVTKAKEAAKGKSRIS